MSDVISSMRVLCTSMEGEIKAHRYLSWVVYYSNAQIHRKPVIMGMCGGTTKIFGSAQVPGGYYRGVLRL
jgi:hypothetical protein